MGLLSDLVLKIDFKSSGLHGYLEFPHFFKKSQCSQCLNSNATFKDFILDIKIIAADEKFIGKLLFSKPN